MGGPPSLENVGARPRLHQHRFCDVNIIGKHLTRSSHWTFCRNSKEIISKSLPVTATATRSWRSSRSAHDDLLLPVAGAREAEYEASLVGDRDRAVQVDGVAHAGCRSSGVSVVHRLFFGGGRVLPCGSVSSFSIAERNSKCFMKRSVDCRFHLEFSSISFFLSVFPFSARSDALQIVPVRCHKHFFAI